MASDSLRLRLPGWAQDVLIVVFVIVMQVGGTRNASEAVGEAGPGLLGLGLLVAGALALLVRRRAPVAVFVVVALLNAGYFASGNPDGGAAMSLLVAAYTLTAHGDGRRSLWIATGGLAGLAVVWLLAAELEPFAEAGWLFFRIGAAVMAAALGESVRSRRVIAADAQRRMELAERTREEEARRRVDAERLRIAREVHDTVAHALAIVNVQSGVTAHVLDKRPERAREALLTIERTSARALRELRATLGVLRDATDGGGDRLSDAIAGLGQLSQLTAMAREAGLDITIEMAPPVQDLPSAVDRAAYRILQESITNVIRHAGSARVTISVATTGDELAIRVADDGPAGPPDGPPSTAAGPPGRGIAGMRERCALLGGELIAAPVAGGGFEVRARLPLAAGASAAA